MRKKSVIILIIMMMVTMVACAPEEKVAMKVATLKGPTGMGMVQLMNQNEKSETAVDYDFTILAAPDEMIGKIISGDVDIAAVPTNLASVLYNKTEGEVQLAAVNTLGVLYVLENGEEIKSIKDLKGKKVIASGKGSTPDYIFQYLLRENGLEIGKDVEVDFKIQHADVTAMLAAGDVSVALLPQPFVTTALMKNENLNIAIDITEEWKNVMDNEGELAMGCIVVRKEYAEKNKEALDKFLDEYKKSVNWVNENEEESSDLIEKYDILPNATIAKQSLPYCNIVYIDAQESKGFLQNYFEILNEFDPKSIGGKLPDEAFYYSR